MANPQCPRCKSYKTQSLRTQLIITGLTISGCLGFIFLILFFPIGIMLFLVGLLIAGTGIAKGKEFICQECKEKFTLNANAASTPENKTIDPETRTEIITPSFNNDEEENENYSNLAQCPYCKIDLEKMPGHKKACPSCKNFMYVRTSPWTNEKIVVTEIGANKIDKIWDKKRNAESFLDELKEGFNVTDGDIEKMKNELTEKYEKAPNESDLAWAVANQLISRKMGDFHTLQMLYYKMAWFLNGEKRDFLSVLQQSAKMSIMEYQKSSVVKKVSIIGSSDSCPACKKLNGKKFNIDVALREMPIPCIDCTRIVDQGVRGFCRCCYAPEV